MSVTFFFFFFLSLSILHSHNIFSTINASLHPFSPFIYLFSSFLPCFSIFFLFPFHLSEQVCIKETNTSTYQLPPSPPLSSSLPFFFFFLSFFPLLSFPLSSIPFRRALFTFTLFLPTLLGHSAEEAVIDVCMARDKAGSPWSDAEKVRSFYFSPFPTLPFHFVPLDCLL